MAGTILKNIYEQTNIDIKILQISLAIQLQLWYVANGCC